MIIIDSDDDNDDHAAAECEGGCGGEGDLCDQAEQPCPCSGLVPGGHQAVQCGEHIAQTPERPLKAITRWLWLTLAKQQQKFGEYFRKFILTKFLEFPSFQDNCHGDDNLCTKVISLLPSWTLKNFVK